MLMKRSCDELLTHCFEDVGEHDYPLLLDSLIGKRMLFKVETKIQQSTQFQGSYPIKRVCTDNSIIGMFELEEGEVTPKKGIFTPSFPDISTDVVDLTIPESDGSEFLLTSPPGGVVNPKKGISTSSLPDISTGILDLTEPESQDGSEFLLTSVPLGDDAFGFGSKHTPAKRYLDADFESCKMGSSSSKLRCASSSKVTGDSLAEEGE